MTVSKSLVSNPSYYLLISTIALLYFFAGKISIYFFSEHTIVATVVFAAEGIALASILFFGKKVWLGILIGQFILAFSEGLGVLPAFEISVVNSLEAVIGYVLFNKYKLNTIPH